MDSRLKLFRQSLKYYQEIILNIGFKSSISREVSFKVTQFIYRGDFIAETPFIKDLYLVQGDNVTGILNFYFNPFFLLLKSKRINTYVFCANIICSMFMAVSNFQSFKKALVRMELLSFPDKNRNQRSSFLLWRLLSLYCIRTE